MGLGLDLLMIEDALIVVATFIGVAGHILKKIIQQRETDNTFSIKRYLSEKPYKTAMTVFYAGAGVAGLYYSDTQAIYTAFLAGYAANSVSGASDS